jgi:hypothetical protein
MTLPSRHPLRRWRRQNHLTLENLATYLENLHSVDLAHRA